MLYGYEENSKKNCFKKQDKQQSAGFNQKNENNTTGKQSATASNEGDIINFATGGLAVQVANNSINLGLNLNLLAAVDQENEVEKEVEVEIED